MATIKTEFKILVVGGAGVGKTAMRSILFADYNLRDISKLLPTKGIEKSFVDYFGNIKLNFWDCAGGDLDEIVSKDSQQIFSNVALLVFVFDALNLSDKTIPQLEACTSALRSFSSEAKLAVLFNKSDMVKDQSQLKDCEALVKKAALPTLATVHTTSIWDESLYRAWSTILTSLITSITTLQAEVNRLQERLKCDEAALYDHTSLLHIVHSGKRNYSDCHRFERVSNILRQMKMSTKRFDSAPVQMQLVMEDSTGLLMVSLGQCILVLISSSATEQSLSELISDAKSFNTVIDVVLEGKAELDPHML